MLGIVAISLSWIPLVNALSFVLGLIGLVLGIVALVTLRGSHKRGKGLSIAGLVTSVVALVFAWAMYAAASAALNEVSAELKKSASVEVTQSQDTGAKEQKSDEKKAEEKKTEENAAPKNGEEILLSKKYLVQNVTVAKTGVDAQGKPVVAVSYDFTNKSDKDAAPLAAINVDVFQNKQELSTAIVVDKPEGYDPLAGMNQVEPGGKMRVMQLYVLGDETSPVTVKIKPFLALGSEEWKKEFNL